jgi:transcription termination factor Rho
MSKRARHPQPGPGSEAGQWGRGILRLPRTGAATLVDPAQPGDEIAVPAGLVRDHGLVEGATVAGPVRSGSHGRELAAVASVCGLTPEAFRDRTPFSRLVAVDPFERFRLGASGEPGMRIIDLIPRRGTRG